MAKQLSEFDRGALAVVEVVAGLNSQAVEFFHRLKGAWGPDAIHWEAECIDQQDNDWNNQLIDLWVELAYDPDQPWRSALWQFDICRWDGIWEVNHSVELDNEDRIIAFEPKNFESFEQVRESAPTLLAELFATRVEVERRLPTGTD